MDSRCFGETKVETYADKWDERDFSVSSVVLKVEVHVSSVMMTFEGSTTPVGISETRMGLNGGGGGEVGMLTGSGGIGKASSVIDTGFALRDGRSEGAGGGARVGRGGGLGTSTTSPSRNCDSSNSGMGRGGRGGLWGDG